MHAHAHAHAHAYAHELVRSHTVHTPTQHAHTCAHTCTHTTQTCTHRTDMRTSMSARPHTHTHTHKHTHPPHACHACADVRMWAYVCARVQCLPAIFRALVFLAFFKFVVSCMWSPHRCQPLLDIRFARTCPVFSGRPPVRCAGGHTACRAHVPKGSHTLQLDQPKMQPAQTHPPAISCCRSCARA